MTYTNRGQKEAALSCRRTGATHLFAATYVFSDRLGPSSKTTLWGRLRQHRGQLSGSNPGGGNHRASIFRAHVSTALIRSGNWPEGLLEAWTSHHPRPEWATYEAQVELEVSGHIRAMPFVWLAVPSRPDRSSDRGYIEGNAIALLSCVTGGQDRPSADGSATMQPAPRSEGLVFGMLKVSMTATILASFGLWPILSLPCKTRPAQ